MTESKRIFSINSKKCLENKKVEQKEELVVRDSEEINLYNSLSRSKLPELEFGQKNSTFNIQSFIAIKEIEWKIIDITEIGGCFYIVLVSFNRLTNLSHINIIKENSSEIVLYKEHSRLINNFCVQKNLLVVEAFQKIIGGLKSIPNKH